MQLKIGYLFQCSPRATPWVLTEYKPTPCKGKSFKTSRSSATWGSFFGLFTFKAEQREKLHHIEKCDFEFQF